MDFILDKTKTKMQEWTNILNTLPSQTPTIEILMANRNINHNQFQRTNTNFNQLLLNPTRNANLEQVLSQLNNLHNPTPLTQMEKTNQTPPQSKSPETQNEPKSNIDIQNTNTNNLHNPKNDENCTSNSSTHHSEKPHQCKICQKGYFNLSSLLRHTQIKHEEKPSQRKTYKMQKKNYECNICKKAFSSICSLQRHLKTINHNTQPKTKRKGPYICKICQKEYTQPHSLQRHIKIDHNGHPTEVPTTAEERSKHPSNGTECYTCQKILPTIHQFLRHNQNHHKNQSTFKCVICGKTYKSNACLTTHSDTIHWRHPNQGATLHKRHCFMCRITFENHQTYRTHLKEKHKNQTEYKCAICQLSFPYNQSLRRHTLKMHNHLGELPTKQTKLPQQQITSQKPETSYEPTTQAQQIENMSPLQTENLQTQVDQHQTEILHSDQSEIPTTPEKQQIDNMSPLQTENLQTQADQHQTETLYSDQPEMPTTPEKEQIYDMPLLETESPLIHEDQYHTDTSDSDQSEIPTTPQKENQTTHSLAQPNDIITCSLCLAEPNEHETEQYPNQYTLICHQMEEHPDHFANKNLHATINQYSTLFDGDQDDVQPMHFPFPMTIKPARHANTTAPYAYACSLCTYSTNTVYSLNNHVQDKHYDYYDLHRTLTIQHLQSHLYKCTLCNTSFYYLNGLTNHIDRHKQHRKTLKLWQYTCPNYPCTTTTHHIKHMIRHIRTTHDPNIDQVQIKQTCEKTPIIPMYKCTICNTAFKQEKELQNHTEQRSHSDQAKTFRENQEILLLTSPYKCNTCCDEPFIDLLSLEQHNNKEEITPGKHEQYHIP